jgi:hypothetical protein
MPPPRQIIGPNGTLTLPRSFFGIKPKLTAHGGPYRNKPRDMPGVCLLEDRPASWWSEKHPDSVWLPIKDFSVPEPIPTVRALKDALLLLLQGRPIYVGCAGGYGRTGTFLSLLAKVYGVKDPVAFVRINYHGHAVETAQQMRFVTTFDVAPLRRWLRLQLFYSIFGR